MSIRKLEILSDQEYSDDESEDDELLQEEYEELVEIRINDAMHEYALELNQYCKEKSLLLCESLKHKDLCNFLLDLLEN
tara:strand:- start:44 stop:280 length:237 start_codon:yes stop_codon:yes gene_type:complete